MSPHAEAIIATARTWTGVMAPSGLGAALIAGLQGSAEALTLYEGPAFRFPPPLMVPFGATRLYPGHAHLLHPELADIAADLRHSRPVFAVLRDGLAVSVCFSARISAEAAEAGVKTVEAFRGRGCAQLATDAWASEIRKTDRIPLYSTSWGNRASQAVARKLELELIGEDIHLTPVAGYS